MMITIERLKWLITNPGASFSRTVMPPSTAWAATPSGSSVASTARSERNGLRVNARIITTIVTMPTMPDSERFENSISAWSWSGG
jgi:hypothetical protein